MARNKNRELSNEGKEIKRKHERIRYHDTPEEKNQRSDKIL